MNEILLKLKNYRKLSQKGNDENYIIDRFIVRKISIFITIPFLLSNATPNQVTFLSLLFLISGLFFLLSNTPSMLLIGAFFVFVYYLLDHVDGELARYYNRTIPQRKKTLEGQYFDVLCHSFSANIIIFFFGISSWKIFGYEWPIIISFLISISMARFPELIANKILIQAIANQADSLRNYSAIRALKTLEIKSSQIEAVQAPLRSLKKWIKIVKEILGFPGLLLLMILAAILDAIFSNFTLWSFSMNFRLLLIVVLFPIESIRLLVRSYTYFKLFKTIAIT
jgi:phosphatidylglycerophosphate synthase